MATFAKLREIVEDPDVAQQIDDQGPNFVRFDDAWEGLKWLLSRKADQLGESPRAGSPNLRLYVQAGDLLADAPEIWILYEIEGDRIVIQSIRFSKASCDQEDDTT